jgi:hypothetical protein
MIDDVLKQFSTDVAPMKQSSYVYCVSPRRLMNFRWSRLVTYYAENEATQMERKRLSSSPMPKAGDRDHRNFGVGP